MAIQKTRIDIPTDVVRQIALEHVMGTSLRALEEKFKYSRPVIGRALSSEDAKVVIQEYQGQVKAAAIASLRGKICGITDLIFKAIEDGLKRGDLKAVVPALKILGIEEANGEKTNSVQAIQVILPGAQAPTKEPKDADVIQEG